MTGTQQVAKTEQLTIAKYLASQQRAIRSALPKHLTVERLSRLAMTACRKNPTLLKADVVSLFGAIMECAQYGLEPGITAHLVPYYSTKRKIHLVNYIADYRGLIALARRSGEIGPFYAFAVREHDEFDYGLGLEPFITHKPAEGERGEITHFYAVAKAKDNSWSQFDVMTKAQVDAIRGRSQASENGPWVTDYEPMGCKTVVRRLCKYLPVSVELQQVVTDDEAAERGEQQHSWIDGEYEVEEPLRDQIKRTSANGNGAHTAEEKSVEDPSYTEERLLREIAEATTPEAVDYLSSMAQKSLKGAQLKRMEGVITERMQSIQESSNA